MIIKCPECSQKEQVSPRNNEDFVKIVCDGCGQIFHASLVRCEAREEVHMKE